MSPIIRMNTWACREWGKGRMLCGTFNRSFRFDTRESKTSDPFSDFAEGRPLDGRNMPWD